MFVSQVRKQFAACVERCLKGRREGPCELWHIDTYTDTDTAAAVADTDL